LIQQLTKAIKQVHIGSITEYSKRCLSITTIHKSIAFMLKKSIFLLLMASLMFGSVSCNRSGCPANAEQTASKKKNQKTKSGLFPKGYSGKKR